MELPPEALSQEEREKDMVGVLQMSLYGTRDAAANFQAEVRKVMLMFGFAQSAYNPSLYVHERRSLKTLVHGDDFVTVGQQKDAEWLKEKLEERFEVKTKMIGSPGKTDGSGGERRYYRSSIVKEGRVLNRIIRKCEGEW